LNSPVGSQAVFWDRLLSLADTIESRGLCAETVNHLLAIEVGFAGSFEPTEEYPEYAAMRLCMALQRHLEKSAD
tara:strand:- start:2931 stop:3152 length:222 start_codon:yes stop_codon:yes gene_type:complete